MKTPGSHEVKTCIQSLASFRQWRMIHHRPEVRYFLMLFFSFNPRERETDNPTACHCNPMVAARRAFAIYRRLNFVNFCKVSAAQSLPFAGKTKIVARPSRSACSASKNHACIEGARCLRVISPMLMTAPGVVGEAPAGAAIAGLGAAEGRFMG